MRRRFRTVQEVAETQQAGRKVLMDLRNGRYHTLNAVGSLVWSVLSDGATLEMVLGCVQEEFETPEEGWAREVESFVEKLWSLNLIRLDD